MIRENDYKRCKCGKYYIKFEEEDCCQDCLDEYIAEHKRYIKKKGKNYHVMRRVDFDEYMVGDFEIDFELNGNIYFWVD